MPVQVTEASPKTAGRIEIVLPGDRRVQVIGRVERQTLAEVLAVLVAGAPAGEARGC